MNDTSKELMPILAMMVKHIYFGNISQKNAQKSIKDLIENCMDMEPELKENLKTWSAEYLSNCATKRNLVEWHDLRKKPDDLPPAEGKDGHYSITVLNERLDKVFYDFKTKEWKEPVFGDKERTPRAWSCGYYFKVQDEEDDE